MKKLTAQELFAMAKPAADRAKDGFDQILERYGIPPGSLEYELARAFSLKMVDTAADINESLADKDRMFSLKAAKVVAAAAMACAMSCHAMVEAMEAAVAKAEKRDKEAPNEHG